MGGFRYVGFGFVLAVSLIGFGTASATSYTATPVQIGSLGQIPGTGPQVRFEIRSPTHGTRYGNALVPVSAASLGKMAVRAATTNIPLHLAIMAFVAAKDNWEWDPVNHKFTGTTTDSSAGSAPDYSGIGNGSWDRSFNHSECPNSGFSSFSDLQAGEAGLMVGISGATHLEQQSSFKGGFCDLVHVRYKIFSPSFPNGYNAQLIWRVGNGSHAYQPGPSDTTTPTDITTTQVGESIADPATATQTATLIRTILQTTINNPTTITNDWPEMNTSVTSIETSFTTYDVTIGDDFVDSSTEYHGMEVEFPVFCEWASVVCDFIDWVKEPPVEPDHPEIPEEEPEMVQWESGVGDTGSCPAPYVTSFQGQAISIPFDDVCWGAESVFRPLLIALSLIAAGFILVGVRGTA